MTFQTGPDPFGRTWHVLFKFLQTAISIRHSDSVDVRFILDNGGIDNNQERIEKTIVLPNAELRAYSAHKHRPLNDSWCARLAMCKIRQVIETGEDLEKDYIAVTPREIEEFDYAIKKWEDEWIRSHAA